MTSTIERMLAVLCRDWSVTAAGYATDTPVAITNGNVITCCSAAARAEGITVGLRKREAQGRCAKLIVVKHDDSRDARAFEAIVCAVERFTPRVEVMRPGLCAMATRGPSRYFGGDAALVAAVAAACRLAATSRTIVQVGIADGIFAAELAAHHSTVVEPNESPSFLAPLSVDTLARPELADLLQRLGLSTLGAFAALSAGDVVDRFGPDGARAHRYAAGIDDRKLVARIPAPELAVSIEFDPPVLRVDAAVFAARTLATQLSDGLAYEGIACTSVAIEAETEHGESLSRVWRHDGTMTGAAISERVRWQLEGWFHRPDRPTAGLTKLCLIPDDVMVDHGKQLMFWGGTGEADERAGKVLARVQGMLGAQGALVAVLQGGRQPGQQVRLVPWGDAREPISDPRAPWPGSASGPAPARVYPDPLPAELLDSHGESVVVTGRGTVTAAPVKLSVTGAPWRHIVGWTGPWPLDERWWDAQRHTRCARFQAVTDAGEAFLLSSESQRWWIDAAFD